MIRKESQNDTFAKPKDAKITRFTVFMYVFAHGAGGRPMIEGTSPDIAAIVLAPSKLKVWLSDI